MNTQDKIRQAALDNGWTIKAKVGQSHNYGRGGTYDRDIFVIGRVERNLQDGTPVVECEHSISVVYRRDGAVCAAHGHTFTVPQVIYRRGILGTRREANKAARIIAALAAQTSNIPAQVAVNA
jgi:hypothetical protein